MEGARTFWEAALPILYQYGIGAGLLALGLWCGFKSGVMDLHRRFDKAVVIIVIGGYFAFLGMHCFFQFVAPKL